MHPARLKTWRLPRAAVFQPEFMAVCDRCGQVTPWFKANRMVESDDGRALALKGYKCAGCSSFEEKVLDTRGRIRGR